MTPTVLLGLSVAVVIGAVLYIIRRVSRHARAGRPVDFGMVSTRWLSELRRDEPWTRS
jgi:hypothetical protein